MSIYKARISTSIDNLNILTKECGLDSRFLTSPAICKDTSEVVGKQQDVMLFIGFLANHEHFYGLEHVSKV
jgi:hypothetical protein